MIHSIAFTKWVLLNKFHTKHGDIQDVHHFISLLDQHIWDEFELTSDYASIINPAVQTIIPLLVQNMPANSRKNQKGKSNKHIDINASNISTSDSDTNKLIDHIAQLDEQTNIAQIAQDKTNKKTRRTNKSNKNDIVVTEEQKQNNIVQDEPNNIVDKPTKKPRGPNKPKNIDTVAEEPNIIVDKPTKKTRGPNKPKKFDTVQEEPNIIVDKPIKKPRGPNKPKKFDTVQEEPNIIVDKPIKKPRGPNKPKKFDNIIIADEPNSIITEAAPTKKTKGRPSTNNKNTIIDSTNNTHSNAPDDIVIPIHEFHQLHSSHIPELQEESFIYDNNNNEIELTEIFIQDVLFYVDDNDNWFDSHLTSVLKPSL